MKSWLEVGLRSDNTLCYINVNEINQNLGYRLCCALPGYHAFTWCNLTASFSREGKLNPLKNLRKNAMVIKVFNEIEEKETINWNKIRDTEKLASKVYENKQVDSVNDNFLKYS